MKTYIAKLKHILPTLFAITVGCIVLMLLIRWLFCIQFPIVDLKEEMWNVWIPVFFPWIPITLWLRQRFRVLVFSQYQDRRQFLFQLLSWFIIAAPLFFSQLYFTTATGKLETIPTIKQINNVEKVRYYKINKFFVANSLSRAYSVFRTSGKYSQHLNFDIYFVMPILTDSSEQITGIPKNWYSVTYTKQTSNNISDEEKESQYKTFYGECVQKLNEYDFYSLDHFERLPTSDDKSYFLKAIEARTQQNTDNSFIILKAIQERYEDRNGNKFAWIFGSFGICLGLFLLLLTWPGYSEAEREKFLAGKKPRQDDIIDVLNYLVPKGDHFATSIIIDLNILVFVAMIFSGISIISPNGSELLLWGGNRRTEILNGEYWRLITNIFVHSGAMHLIVNIYGLVLAALFVEPLFKARNFFILYFASGICASLASIYWHANTVSIGASGAIFGLYGAMLGLLLTNAFPKYEKKSIFTLAGFYVGINLLWGLTGGIDNAAHIGGLLSGAVLGIILYELDKRRLKIK